MIEIRLLGQFSVRRDGSPVEIRSRPAQTLLAYLLLTPNTPHRREKLAGLLWPDSTDANSRSYLRKALWQLRKSLPAEPGEEGEHFLVDDISIEFSASSDYWLDADVVGERLSSDAPIDDLIAAIAAYQGELLPGFYEEWVGLERDRIESAFDQKMGRLVDQLIEHQRWGQVVEWGEQWIALGKAPEPAYRALMTAHANAGDRAKVAAAYARCTEALEDELGVPPSEQTEALYARLMSGSASELVEKPAKTRERRSAEEPVAQDGPARIQVNHNLPAVPSSFVGRGQEMAEVQEQLDASRMMTLTGPGGSGKTRLALQVAGSLVDQYSDGVWHVEFGSLAEPELVPQEVASVLGLPETQERTPAQVLLENLRTRHMLLVFDNCEHLIQPCAELVEILLRGCPQVHILATSREALSVTGEVAWIVPPLRMPLPDEQVPFEVLLEYDAIRLFAERARTARSTPPFEITEGNAQVVVSICQRLDGIPLAVELAAARLKTLSIEQVAARLEDRFSLLTTGSRTALPRQQTLRATMDWSYDLLPKNEQAMLRQLSVFSGGWSLESAEMICRPLPGSFLPDSGKATIEGYEALDMLSNLVEKSLIVVDSKRQSARYRMLETIRDYSREKRLETIEDSAARDRHLEIFLQLAEQVEPLLQADDQVIWFDRLQLELDNIRAAIEWSMAAGDPDEAQQSESRIEAGLRLAGSLAWFFQNRNRLEPLGRLSRLIAQPKAAKKTKWRAKALNAVGFLNLTLGNYKEAQKVLEEALEIGRNLEDAWNTAWALNYLGAASDFQGIFEAADGYLKEGLLVSRKMGDEGRFPTAWSLAFLGDLFLYRDDLERAGSLYEESVAITRELKNRNFLAYSARRLGYVALKSEEFDRALELFTESLMLNREIDHRLGIASSLGAFGKVAALEGELIRAAKLLGATDTVINEIATPLYMVDRFEYENAAQIVRSKPEDQAITAAWEEGQGMSLEEALDLALEPRGGVK